MRRTEELHTADLVGVYREIAEVIGVEATIMLHERFQGQQITLPKKLYTKEYIVSRVKKDESKFHKYKRQKVAMDLDNVYRFFKQEIEGTTSIDVMKQYEKNVKLQKAINVVSIALIASFLGMIIFN